MLPHAWSRGVCIVCGDYETINANKQGCRGFNKQGQLNPKPSDDPVNHPQHYTNHPSGIECITITRHMNFNLGNAIKYIWRYSSKSSRAPPQDLEKAIWYLKDEIERCHMPTLPQGAPIIGYPTENVTTDDAINTSGSPGEF